MQPNYGSEFPLDEIAKARQILMGGDWAEQKARLAKCEWRLQGYAFLLGFGDPDVVGTQSEESLARLLPSDEQLVELEQLVSQCDTCAATGPEQEAAPTVRVSETGTPYAIPAGDTAAGFDPLSLATLIATLAPLAKQLLDWIRNRRNPQPAPEPAPATAAGEIA